MVTKKKLPVVDPSLAGVKEYLAGFYLPGIEDGPMPTDEELGL